MKETGDALVNRSPIEYESDDDFTYFRQRIIEFSGIHLGEGKKELLKARLQHRLNALGLESIHSYRRYLMSLPRDNPEWQEFINQITTNKTEFFREEAHFRYLIARFLPEWLATAPSRPLRVWSAACSTGEEAYSLALVLSKHLQHPYGFEIIASDIDTQVLAQASNGVYRLPRLNEIPSEYHSLGIDRGKGEVKDWFRMKWSLKEKIRFQRLNLISDPFQTLGIFDVIFCRNVFIYFQTETVEQIIRNMSEVLQAEGILVLGHSETVGYNADNWKTSAPSVYRQAQSTRVKESRQRPRAGHRIAAVKDKRKKVLVVDDSKTMRQLLGNLFEKSDKLELIGSLGDPRELEVFLETHKPDVITLDLRMPHLDGCEVLEKILSRYSIPTLIISAVTMEEGREVLRALELGAVDYVEKPSFQALRSGETNLIERVLQAASVKVLRHRQQQVQDKPVQRREQPSSYRRQKSIILMGASTGGVQALTEVLTQLPPSIPPILIVQHIPAAFSAAFASRLDQICPFTVKEAQEGDVVAANQVLIAPGGRHMRIVLDTAQSCLRVALDESEPVNRHRPSVDVMFESAVKVGLGPQLIGILLTGMGNDGARAMKQMKDAGALTIAQDEASSAVFGMPREAIRLGGADHVLPLDQIAPRLIELLQRVPINPASKSGTG